MYSFNPSILYSGSFYYSIIHGVSRVYFLRFDWLTLTAKLIVATHWFIVRFSSLSLCYTIMFTLMIVILKLLRLVSDMPKDKGDEWTHVSLIEESGVTTDGKVRLVPLLKCIYCEKRFSGGA